MTKTVTAIKFILWTLAILLVSTSLSFAFDPDPFNEYGKKLPWDSGEQWYMSYGPTQHGLGPAQDFIFEDGPQSTVGKPVLAISDGIISQVIAQNPPNDGAGIRVKIDHENGFTSHYFHLSSATVTVDQIGTRIRQGQMIGAAGQTGVNPDGKPSITAPNLQLGIEDTGTGVRVYATDDGRQFDGVYNGAAGENLGISPIDTFNYRRWHYFVSDNTLRPDDPNNPDDPDIIDPLTAFIENYGDEFPDEMIADPVQTGTGNFHYSKLDLDLNTQLGPELKLERFHNAQDYEYEGPFGPGWTHNLNIDLLFSLEEGVGTYTVKFGDGRGVSFQEDPNNLGTYISLSPLNRGEFTRLGATEDFAYQYTDQSKTVHKFIADDANNPAWGKILSITDTAGHSLTFTYDSAFVDTDTPPDGIPDTWEGSGMLTKVENSFGRFIEFANDTNSKRVTRITDSAGRNIDYSYNFDNHLTQMVLPNGSVWKYTNTTKGQVESVTDGNGNKFVENVYINDQVNRQYDGEGNETIIVYGVESGFFGLGQTQYVTRMYDGRGNESKYVHNEELYLIEEVTAEGNSTKYEYNNLGQRIKKTDPEGNVYEYEYDAFGNLIKESHPNGYQKTIDYDLTFNLPLKVTDNSGIIEYTYTPFGKTEQIVYQDGEVVKFEYDTNNVPDKNFDKNNEPTDIQYNAQGLIELEKDLNTGSYLRYEYDLAGNRTKVIDGLGQVSEFKFTALGDVWQTINPEGHVVTYTLDNNGNILKEENEEGYVTEYIVDKNENVTEIKYPNGGIEYFEFDENNNQTKYTDRNGNYVTHEYDKDNRKEQSVFYDKNHNFLTFEQFEYDKNNNQIKFTDGNNNSTEYKYNEVNEVEEIKNPNGDKTEFTINELRQIVKEKDFRGNITEYTYYADGMLHKVIDSFGKETEYFYDGEGNTIKISAPLGVTTEFTYDSADRVIQEKSPNGYTKTMQYDLASNLVRQTNFAGEISNYSYYPDGKLKSQSDFYSNTTQFEYDKRNLLKSITDPNGHKTTYENNEMGWRSKTTDPKLNFSTSEYDNFGNLIKMTAEDGTFVRYEFDGLNRTVKEIDQLNKETKYEYDRVGNQTRVIDRNGNPTEFEYDNLNRIRKIINAHTNTSEFEYDENGNRTKLVDFDGTYSTFVYDENNRLNEITNQNFNKKTFKFDDLGRVTEETDFKGNKSYFAYDYNGNIEKSTDREGRITLYQYDGENRILKESKLSSGGSISSETVYDNAGRIDKLTNPEGGTTIYTYDKASNIKEIKNPRGYTTSFTYDELNRQTETKDPTGAINKIEFDSMGRMIKQTDPVGNITEFKYTERGNIETEIDADGYRKHFDYDNEGNLIGLTDGNSNLTTFVYDELNRLTQTNYPDLTTEIYTLDKLGRVTELKNRAGFTSYNAFDNLGNVLSETDPDGFSAYFEYDENNNLVKTQNKRGFTSEFIHNNNDELTRAYDNQTAYEEFKYDDLGRQIEYINKLGKSTKYNYSANGWLIEEVDALTNSTKYTYDKNGNVTKLTDAEGNITEFIFDERDLLKQEKDAIGNSMFYTYYPTGLVNTETDKNGNITTYQYNKRNIVSASSDANGIPTEFEYDGNQNLLVVKDVLNNHTKYQYDNMNRKTIEILAEGQTTRYKYDGYDNVTEMTTPNNTVYKYEYNQRGLLTKVIDPLTNTLRYDYDEIGNLIKSFDGRDKLTENQYDSMDRLTKVYDPLRNMTEYKYDFVGNMTEEIDANTNSTIYTYDDLNRLKTETNAIGKIWTFNYDKVGNLDEMLDPNGIITNYVYNPTYDLTEVILNGGAQTMEFDYDPAHNMIKASKDSFENTFAYDKLNRIKSTNDSRGYQTSYEFDQLRNLSKVTYPDGKEVEYAYDNNNWLETMTQTFTGDQRAVSFPHTLTTKFEFDNNQNLVKQTFPNNSYNYYEYDNADRLTKVGAKTTDPTTGTNEDILQRVYTLNKNGDATKEVGKTWVNGNVTSYTRNYTYDDARRLTRTFEGWKNMQSYKYDKVGNRITEIDRSKSNKRTRYVYNEVNQLVSDNQFVYSYDNNGNMLSKKSKNGETFFNYEYDLTNRLTTVDSRKLDEFSGEYQNYDVSYQYDALGRRVTKTNNSNFNLYTDVNSAPELFGINQIDYVHRGSDWEILAEYTDKNENIIDTATVSVDLAESESLYFESLSDKELKQVEKERTEIIKLDDVDATEPTGNGNNTDSGSEINTITDSGTSLDSAQIESGTDFFKQENRDSKDWDKWGNGPQVSRFARIDVCVIRIDLDNNILEPSQVPAGTSFSMNMYDDSTPIYPSNPDNIGTNPTNITIPGDVANNRDLIGNDGVNDAYCQKVDTFNKINQNYTFAEMDIESDFEWANPKYNDQFTRNVSTLSDFFEYDGRLFDGIPSNDEDRRGNADGHIKLSRGRGKRTLVVINQLLKYTDVNIFDDHQNFYYNGYGSELVSTNSAVSDNAIRQEMLNSLQTVEKYSYYHKDRLRSVIGTTNYEHSYSLVPNIPVEVYQTNVLKPNFGGGNKYSDFGEIEKRTNKFSANLTGLTNASSRSYSGEQYDPETGNLYYGSRYYDSGVGRWNRPDEYRGEVNMPSTRHRYAFVNNNPVNNRDLYGFTVNKEEKTPQQRIADLKTKSDTINNNSNEIKQINSILPGLIAQRKYAGFKAQDAIADHGISATLKTLYTRQAEAWDKDVNYEELMSALDERIHNQYVTKIHAEAQYRTANNAVNSNYARKNELINENVKLIEEAQSEFEDLGDWWIDNRNSLTDGEFQDSLTSPGEQAVIVVTNGVLIVGDLIVETVITVNEQAADYLFEKSNGGGNPALWLFKYTSFPDDFNNSMSQFREVKNDYINSITPRGEDFYSDNELGEGMIIETFLPNTANLNQLGSNELSISDKSYIVTGSVIEIGGVLMTADELAKLGYTDDVGKALTTTVDDIVDDGAKMISKNTDDLVGQKYTIDDKKYDYFFGKVTTGNEHNITRSAQNADALQKLGINDKNSLRRVFDTAIDTPTIKTKTNEYGITNVKKVEVGEGAIEVSFFYEQGDLNNVPKITTLIPKL